MKYSEVYCRSEAQIFSKKLYPAFGSMARYDIITRVSIEIQLQKNRWRYNIYCKIDSRQLSKVRIHQSCVFRLIILIVLYFNNIPNLRDH